METPRPKTTFFSLPPELRLQIYDLVLLDSPTLSKSHPSSPLYTWIDIRRFRHGKPDTLTYRPPPLLSTSALIRREASPTYYSKIQFRFTEVDVCIKWLKGLDDAARGEVRDLAYCPNYFTWMDPRREPVKGLGRLWRELGTGLEELGVRMEGVVRICGFARGRVGWVVVEGVDEEGGGG